MALDLTLSSESQQTISDVICKIIAKNEGEVVQPSIQELISEAINFKSNLEAYRTNLQTLEDIDQEKKKLYVQQEQARSNKNIDYVINSVKQLRNKDVQHINEYKKLQSFHYMQTILHFQNVLNNFFGQRMILTLVDNETGTIYFSTTEDYAQFLSLRGNFAIRFDGDIKNIIQRMEDNNFIMGQVNIDSLEELERNPRIVAALQNVQWAHQSALWRINRSFEVEKGVGVILWKSLARKGNSQGWYGVVATRGIIAEAYAEILITRQEQVFYNTQHTIEPLLDIFILNYMTHVTNAAGAVFGDISDSINNLDYAVKTSNASLLIENQLIAYANVIINNQNNLNTLIQELEKKKKEDVNGDPIMAQGIEKVDKKLTQTVQQNIEQTIENYNNSQSNWWDKR